ncbi:MAG TPA: amylo-alpha-1,6-glucosidase [Fimbriimonadaceae bacterium]|nr:amylo-alpha-1,6-glucosidase [Fimbriimonadaceae bacterium]
MLKSEPRSFEALSAREWLCTNGIGGYAMGTVSGANTRRYHGHLVACVNDSLHRVVLLANVEAFAQTSGDVVGLSTNRYNGAIHPDGYRNLKAFRSGATQEWIHEVQDIKVQKRLGLRKGRNSAQVEYTNLGTKPIRLSLRPLVCHKFYHGDFSQDVNYPSGLEFGHDQTVITAQSLPLQLLHPAARREPFQGWYYRFEHERETERGLSSRGDLFCPCELSYELAPGERAILLATAEVAEEPWELSETYPEDTLERLNHAADLFLLDRPRRKSIIAGYPWFTDWGRDTMIALPGLTRDLGNSQFERAVLRGYASHMSRGIIPNRTVETGLAEYNTADASLWFVNAIYQSLSRNWDQEFAAEMASAVEELVCHHVAGTHYGIAVDPKSGLLTQGTEGTQLTWMDAKIGEWVVTPRHGKPVEINGLWINALRVAQWLSTRLGQDPAQFAGLAEHAEANFELKFWNEKLGYYLDTADPDDASLRPNQLIAMSLPFAPANTDNASRALAVIREKLLTPYGLRTLAPECAGYRGRFKGALQELDAAYHQGTVWPWLLGPYCDAVMKTLHDRAEVERVLAQVPQMLDNYGINGIAEVYDGHAPQTPGGCPWQAWSVAEVRRVVLEYGLNLTAKVES